jgi:hypothetical protein
VWRLALGLVVAILTAGCGPSAGPPAASGTSAGPVPASSSAAGPATVDPERIKRIRSDLPPGYEVADVKGPVSIAGFWGFRPGWTADPSSCAALVDPIAAESSPVRGLSGSGPGGIVYVVVETPPQGTLAFDPALTDQCVRWTMAFGQSSAAVDLVDAPPIDGASTVGMTAAIRTVVESGNETDSHATTFSAYVGDHFVFVALVTDPGSPDPPLPPEFAADLLVKTVAALRG